MGVENIEFTSIEGKTFKKRSEKISHLRIDTNSTIVSISPIGEEEVDVDFRYTVSYGPIGIIKVEGRLVYKGSDAKTVSERWLENRNMPNKVASEIHTAIVQACIPESAIIAKELSLPMPFPLPKVNITDKKEGGGPSAIEVV